MSREREAIERLIREVNATEKIRHAVPRRIFVLFAVTFAVAVCLLVFAVTAPRRSQPVR
jgi:hypothetical protein